MNNKCQKIFDLLKIVHILDLDQVYNQNDPIYSTIKQISTESRSVLSHYKYPGSNIRTEKSNQTQMEVDLIGKKEDVQVFYNIILAINIGWQLIGEPQDWSKVSKKISCGAKNAPNRQKCYQTFHKWTRFYAKVFSY